MKERPILFSAPMVRALLDGSKTQTRRIVKPQPLASFPHIGDISFDGFHPHQPVAQWSAEAIGGGAYKSESMECPHGQPGDRLWVREAWRTVSGADDIPPRNLINVEPFTHYEADGGSHAGMGKLRPSMFMPRWASRILLEIVSVRIERLQDISENDCWSEGIEACDGLLDDVDIINCAKRMKRSFEDAAPTYATLWESINGPGSWDANPWVWVIEFKQVPA